MRYFIDFEFIEDGKTIDPISLGIVAEDGRDYYAIFQDCNIENANDWVKENVIAHLPPRFLIAWGGERLADPLYKSKEQIREDLLAFIGTKDMDAKLEFWGYYSAYDHVALCQVFGTMMELPRGWPMYTRDLRQWADSIGITDDLDKHIPTQSEHHALADARWNKRAWEFLHNFESFGK